MYISDAPRHRQVKDVSLELHSPGIINTPVPWEGFAQLLPRQVKLASICVAKARELAYLLLLLPRQGRVASVLLLLPRHGRLASVLLLLTLHGHYYRCYFDHDMCLSPVLLHYHDMGTISPVLVIVLVIGIRRATHWANDLTIYRYHVCITIGITRALQYVSLIHYNRYHVWVTIGVTVQYNRCNVSITIGITCALQYVWSVNYNRYHVFITMGITCALQ